MPQPWAEVHATASAPAAHVDAHENVRPKPVPPTQQVCDAAHWQPNIPPSPPVAPELAPLLPPPLLLPPLPEPPLDPSV